MNRLNRYLSGALAALLAAAAPALCADLLIDDFTDAAASHGKWVNKNDSYLNHSVSGGSCTLENTSSQYSGEYYHDFGANKPATFTLSYIQKSIQGGDAGAFFCRQAGNNFSGYFLTLRDGDLLVWKLTNGNSSGSPVFEKAVGFDLKAADNKFTVSKSGAKFNVFVNDAFVGGFTDAAYNSGDLSMFIDPNTKAIFGKVQVTDVFTEGSPRTSFSDDFNGNGLRYWEILKNGSPSATEANGVLTVKTADGESEWLYVDFEHPNFTAKIEASHRSGSKSNAYGFVLVGQGAPGQTIPMAHFAITGNREYAVWSSASSNLETNSAILGAASGGMFFVDNLEIKKSAGSPAYEFFANNTLLTTFQLPNGFNLIGIGIFCYGDLEVAFDNFSIVKEGSTLAIINGSKQISHAKPPLTIRDHNFYDMRGRKRYSITPTSSRVQTRAAGVYVNKNGRDVAVRKSRAPSE